MRRRWTRSFDAPQNVIPCCIRGETSYHRSGEGAEQNFRNLLIPLVYHTLVEAAQVRDFANAKRSNAVFDSPNLGAFAKKDPLR